MLLTNALQLTYISHSQFNSRIRRLSSLTSSICEPHSMLASSCSLSLACSYMPMPQPVWYITELENGKPLGRIV